MFIGYKHLVGDMQCIGSIVSVSCLSDLCVSEGEVNRGFVLLKN